MSINTAQKFDATNVATCKVDHSQCRGCNDV